MIGYGIVNSSVHEFCINQIIINFFNRSSFILAPYYMSIKILVGHLDDSKDQKTYSYFFSRKTTKNDFKVLQDKRNLKIIDDIYELFLLEEYKLSSNKQVKFNVVNIDETQSNEILFKYFCSANIILDKDYNFDSKTIDETIREGYMALKEIFTNLFIEFLNNSNITTSSVSSSSKLFSIQRRLLFGKVGIYSFQEKFDNYYSDLYSVDSETEKPKPIVLEEDIPDHYKNLKTKLDSIAKAIGGTGTNEELLEKTLKSLTPQQKCYLCSKKDALWKLNGKKVSAIEAIADDLSGDDLDTYLYNILQCTNFGYKNKIGSAPGDSENKCIEYFEKQVVADDIGKGFQLVPDGVFKEFIKFFSLYINKKYKDYKNDLIDQNSNIIKFYTEKQEIKKADDTYIEQSFLEQRNNYIDLLNNQINVLEGS